LLGWQVRIYLMCDALSRTIFGVYRRWWVGWVIHWRRWRRRRFARRDLLFLLYRKLDGVLWNVSVKAHEPSYVRIQRCHLHRRRWRRCFIAIHFGMSTKLRRRRETKENALSFNYVFEKRHQWRRGFSIILGRGHEDLLLGLQKSR
jgi:hypothetical protein